MPTITKLCLHLLKLFRENYWLLFSRHGVVRVNVYAEFTPTTRRHQLRNYWRQLARIATSLNKFIDNVNDLRLHRRCELTRRQSRPYSQFQVLCAILLGH